MNDQQRLLLANVRAFHEDYGKSPSINNLSKMCNYPTQDDLLADVKWLDIIGLVEFDQETNIVVLCAPNRGTTLFNKNLHQRVYEYLRDADHNLVTPTLKNIASNVNSTHHIVRHHLRVLEKEGKIKRRNRNWSSARVVQDVA